MRKGCWILHCVRCQGVLGSRLSIHVMTRVTCKILTNQITKFWCSGYHLPSLRLCVCAMWKMFYSLDRNSLLCPTWYCSSWDYGLLTGRLWLDNYSTCTYGYYRILIGSHTMTGSAQNRVWCLLTSELGDEAVTCIRILFVYIDFVDGTFDSFMNMSSFRFMKCFWMLLH